MLTLFGLAVALADALPPLLQAVRTVRRASASGLSGFTQATYLMSWSAWLAHAMVVGDAPLVAAAALGLTASALLCLGLFRLAALPGPRRLLGPGAVYGGLTAVILLYDAAFGAAVLAVADLVSFVPQLRLAARAADLSGISVPAYAVEIAVSAAWVAYTLAAGFPSAGLFSAVSVGMFTFVLAKASRSRRRDR